LSISYYDLIKAIADAGVVGMGGAGFPTHLKLRPRIQTVIINGAECEPLLNCDYHLLDNYARDVMEGACLTAESTGAREVVLAIKKKNRKLKERVGSFSPDIPFRIAFLEDIYPSGDEFFIIRDVCGHILPPRDIPSDRGVLVHNAATFKAIADAVNGIPLTHRLVTVCGEVENQITVNAPVGASFADLLAAAGGGDNGTVCRILEGGVMMGTLAESTDVVTKTTAAIVALPESHPAVLERLRPLRYSVRVAEHICCQCLKCTELCSRYLIGHHMEPHKLMRLIGSSRDYRGLNTEMLFNCTGCGLCSLLACPFDLSPRRLILEARKTLSKPAPVPTERPEQRPFMESFVATTQRLIRHLNLEPYDTENRFIGDLKSPDCLRIPLQQHMGVPAAPVVSPGEHVGKGQLLADPPPESMGASVHSPAAGSVERITETHILLQCSPAKKG